MFWEHLCDTLEHSTVIIEGVMHLHNFLPDYREAKYGTESNSNDEAVTERIIFDQDYSDNDNQPIVCCFIGKNITLMKC